VELNKELTMGKLYSSSKDFMPYWARSSVYDATNRQGVLTKRGLIPKKYAIIVYNLIYNTSSNKLIYQEVYCTNRSGTIQLVSGELVIDSFNNRKHLKKFNNKYYIRENFKLSDKKQLLLFK